MDYHKKYLKYKLKYLNLLHGGDDPTITKGNVAILKKKFEVSKVMQPTAKVAPPVAEKPTAKVAPPVAEKPTAKVAPPVAEKPTAKARAEAEAKARATAATAATTPATAATAATAATTPVYAIVDKDETYNCKSGIFTRKRVKEQKRLSDDEIKIECLRQKIDIESQYETGNRLGNSGNSGNSGNIEEPLYATVEEVIQPKIIDNIIIAVTHNNRLQCFFTKLFKKLKQDTRYTNLKFKNCAIIRCYSEKINNGISTKFQMIYEGELGNKKSEKNYWSINGINNFNNESSFKDGIKINGPTYELYKLYKIPLDTEIYLVRHGEGYHNIKMKQKIIGIIRDLSKKKYVENRANENEIKDAILNDSGWKQAKKAGDKLIETINNIKNDNTQFYYVASELRRTMETSLILQIMIQRKLNKIDIPIPIKIHIIPCIHELLLDKKEGLCDGKNMLTDFINRIPPENVPYCNLKNNTTDNCKELTIDKTLLIKLLEVIHGRVKTKDDEYRNTLIRFSKEYFNNNLLYDKENNCIKDTLPPTNCIDTSNFIGLDTTTKLDDIKFYIKIPMDWTKYKNIDCKQTNIIHQVLQVLPK
jgi:hypothetical protein